MVIIKQVLLYIVFSAVLIVASIFIAFWGFLYFAIHFHSFVTDMIEAAEDASKKK